MGTANCKVVVVTASVRSGVAQMRLRAKESAAVIASNIDLNQVRLPLKRHFRRASDEK